MKTKQRVTKSPLKSVLRAKNVSEKKKRSGKFEEKNGEGIIRGGMVNIEYLHKYEGWKGTKGKAYEYIHVCLWLGYGWVGVCVLFTCVCVSVNGKEGP